MLDAVGYEADDSYITQAVRMFGTFDADGNGALDMQEFSRLAERLKLNELLAANQIAATNGHPSAPVTQRSSSEPASTSQYQANLPLAGVVDVQEPEGKGGWSTAGVEDWIVAAFQRFDLDDDGLLGRDEVIDNTCLYVCKAMLGWPAC